MLQDQARQNEDKAEGCLDRRLNSIVGAALCGRPHVAKCSSMGRPRRAAPTNHSMKYVLLCAVILVAAQTQVVFAQHEGHRPSRAKTSGNAKAGSESSSKSASRGTSRTRRADAHGPWRVRNARRSDVHSRRTGRVEPDADGSNGIRNVMAAGDEPDADVAQAIRRVVADVSLQLRRRHQQPGWSKRRYKV